MTEVKAAQETPVKIAFGRIERALIDSHDSTSALESRIKDIYSGPESEHNDSPKALGEPKTFHDAMLKLADMSEALAKRLNVARNNLRDAI